VLEKRKPRSDAHPDGTSACQDLRAFRSRSYYANGLSMGGPSGRFESFFRIKLTSR